MLVEMTVNGRRQRLEADPDETLLAVLRERMGLRGAKDGCSEGECGACTVLLDGQPVDSCIYPAAGAAGRSITTVEGLSPGDGELSALQRAFIETAAVQCGFCTPGFLLTLTALLAETPRPSEREVREAVSGNICRCTGYTDIVAAVGRACGGLR